MANAFLPDAFNRCGQNPKSVRMKSKLVVLTLAMGVMGVTTLALVSEPLLLEATGSLVVAVLDTTLVNVPLVLARMTTVKLVVEP